MFSYFLFVCLFCCLGPHLWHREVPRLGVESKLQLPAYTTPQQCQIRTKPHLGPTPQLTATPDSQPTEQGQGSNRVLMDTSWVCYRWAATGTPMTVFLTNTHTYNLSLSLTSMTGVWQTFRIGPVMKYFRICRPYANLMCFVFINYTLKMETSCLAGEGYKSNIKDVSNALKMYTLWLLGIL